MTNEIIDQLVLPKSEIKQQKLIECVLTANSKQYLGKTYTEEQSNKLSAEEVDKVFSSYKAKLSDQVSWKVDHQDVFDGGL